MFWKQRLLCQGDGGDQCVLSMKAAGFGQEVGFCPLSAVDKYLSPCLETDSPHACLLFKQKMGPSCPTATKGAHVLEEPASACTVPSLLPLPEIYSFSSFTKDLGQSTLLCGTPVRPQAADLQGAPRPKWTGQRQLSSPSVCTVWSGGEALRSVQAAPVPLWPSGDGCSTLRS
jgi:hypothetical protein